MSSPSSQNTFFESLDGPDSIEYQPVSLAATVACALGVASLLALTGRIFWVIPLAAIVSAVFALRQISRSPEPLLGRHRAIFGLVVAIFLGTWAVAADLTWESRLKREAVEKAVVWFELVRDGDTEKAAQLTLRYDRRDPTTADATPGTNTSNSHRSSRLEGFVKQEGIKLFRDAGPQSRFRLDKLLGIDRVEGADLISLRMRIEWLQDGKSESRPIYIEMARHVESKAKSAYWHVNKVEFYQNKASQ